jgi:hypothetical protein
VPSFVLYLDENFFGMASSGTASPRRARRLDRRAEGDTKNAANTVEMMSPQIPPISQTSATKHRARTAKPTMIWERSVARRRNASDAEGMRRLRQVRARGSPIAGDQGALVIESGTALSACGRSGVRNRRVATLIVGWESDTVLQPPRRGFSSTTFVSVPVFAGITVAGDANISATLPANCSRVNGLLRRCTPSSRRPWWTIEFSV